MAQIARLPGFGSALVLLAVLLAPGAAVADLVLAPGFTARTHVTGDGFGTSSGVMSRGFPGTATLAVDHTGALYLARTGRRYSGGEFEYLSTMYRVPPAGATLTPQTESRYFHGPPLTNAQVSGGRAGRELFVSTFDRDRRVGVVYRLNAGRSEFFAGGTPSEPGRPPLLVQPEWIAVGSSGDVYVADRDRGTVLRLDPAGAVLDNFRIARPRTLAMDETDHLWVGSDGNVEAPWQAGPGGIWRIAPGGERRLVLEGPLVQGLAPGPAGTVLVAERQGGEVFLLAPDGSRATVARFTDGDAPRGLAVIPTTDETRAAGLAGDLFVAVIRRGVFQLNEIVRISGPFSELLPRASKR
jgi:hypothetical protein